MKAIKKENEKMNFKKTKAERVLALKKRIAVAEEMANDYYLQLKRAKEQLEQANRLAQSRQSQADITYAELERTRTQLREARKEIKRLEHENSKLIVSSFSQQKDDSSKACTEGIAVITWKGRA